MAQDKIDPIRGNCYLTKMLNTRIRKDILSIQQYQNEFWTASPRDENVFLWDGLITPHPDSIYGKKRIPVQMTFPRDYPMNPPVIKILTHVQHDCVAEDGTIELFRREWSPIFSVGVIMMILTALFNEYDHTKQRQIERVEKVKQEILETVYGRMLSQFASMSF